MKLKKYIKKSNKLIEMPYNQLNLDNYEAVIQNLLNREATFLSVDSNDVISLMSGKHPNAGLLAIANYKNQPTERRMYIIGKGILFDSGGYNLKPGKSIEGMHTDMAGTAIAAIVALYCIKELNINTIAYCPITTNFLHTSKITVGDKIKIGNKIVEVKNTDAEGRLILASALSSLKSIIKKDDIVITIATLTGSCAAAIGDKATAVMGGKRVVKKYLKASRQTKELAWELPLWGYLQKEFDKKIIPNTSNNRGGTITAGMFLKQFVKYPKNWLHLDIAYSATNKKWKATGEPIRTLVKFIKELV